MLRINTVRIYGVRFSSQIETCHGEGLIEFGKFSAIFFAIVMENGATEFVWLSLLDIGLVSNYHCVDQPSMISTSTGVSPSHEMALLTSA